METAWLRLHPSETESLVATLTLRNAESVVRSYRFQIFPGVAGALVEVTSGDPCREELLAEAGASADGIEADFLQENATSREFESPLGPFSLTAAHLRITEVQFHEQSDHHSNFVSERSWMTHISERRLALESNLVAVEDPSSGEGFAMVLLAPTRLVRKQWTSSPDFLVETTLPGEVRSSFGVRITAFPGPYALARIGYVGGLAGRTAALHGLQRAQHHWLEKRDGLIVSNTWGDRGRADRVNEHFIIEEIRAAQRLGVEVVEIDDGWQKGRTANTVYNGGVWNGFWHADPEFWHPDPVRFPRGLSPVAESARASGLHLGLWYAPDSSCEFAHWEKDAATLLHYWRVLDVTHFKLDAVKIVNRNSEQRFLAMLDRVHDESKGAVLFDLDATAELRETYFGHPHGSTLFLENRYTDWGSYYPHQTLRALWTLARYIWPPRLRLEFLNPERNDEVYRGDPLRPSAYPPEALFAICMPASPLAFLENSGVSAGTAERLMPLIATWKLQREAWYAGTLLPVGDEPDGWAWTGFVSVDAGRRCGYALIFRELNGERNWEGSVPLFEDGSYTVERLGGVGNLALQGNTLRVEIPQPLGFIFARVSLP